MAMITSYVIIVCTVMINELNPVKCKHLKNYLLPVDILTPKKMFGK